MNGSNSNKQVITDELEKSNWHKNVFFFYLFIYFFLKLVSVDIM